MVFLLAFIGLILLLVSGDALVRGAASLALRLRIPALIVSLTIVAFGTSAPELVITIKAALSGAPGLALGNVIGSNIANVLLVLGLPGLIAVMAVCDCETRRSYGQMLLASLLFILLAHRGIFDLWAGLVLLAALLWILVMQARMALAHRRAGQDELPEEADPALAGWRIALFILAGLIGLPLGADLLVDSARHIARIFGASDRMIGLTLVAIGTSLPELATTMMAALRRQADVAIGNVIGSNLFNLLAIIGTATLIAPIPVDPLLLRFDLWVMLAASLILMPFVMFRRDLGRVWGAALLGVYMLYLGMVII